MRKRSFVLPPQQHLSAWAGTRCFWSTQNPRLLDALELQPHMPRLGVSHLEEEGKEGTFFTLLSSLFVCQARRNLEGEHMMVSFCVNYFVISQSTENASVSLKWCGVLCCDYYQTWSYLSERNNFMCVEVWGDLIIPKSVPQCFVALLIQLWSFSCSSVFISALVV